MLLHTYSLQTGDRVYHLGNWRKGGVQEIKLGQVHGNFARVGGKLMQLDRDFFRTRGEAAQELYRRIFSARRLADRRHKKEHAALDALQKAEERLAKAAP